MRIGLVLLATTVLAGDQLPRQWRDRARAWTSGIGVDISAHVDAGRVTVRQIDPAELAPGEFVSQVRASVEGGGVRVVVIDSLNGYLNSMPEERYLTAHLHELFSYLRQRGVLTIVVMSQHGLIGPTQTTIDLSYLADSVILTRFFEATGAVHKAISVVKKRAGGHEDTIRELRISERGLSLSEPLTAFRGVFTGVPEYDPRPLLRPDTDVAG